MLYLAWIILESSSSSFYPLYFCFNTLKKRRKNQYILVLKTDLIASGLQNFYNTID